MGAPTNKTPLFAAGCELLDRQHLDLHAEDRKMLSDAVEAARDLAIEVSAVRGFGTGSISTCNDAETEADGFAVYIRNPLAFHVQDFGPESVFEHRRATMMEAKDAAFTYAAGLAEHLGCVVSSALIVHNDPETGAPVVPWIIAQAELITGQGQVTTFLQPDGCWIAVRDTARRFLSEVAALEALPTVMAKFADPEVFSVMQLSEQPPAPVKVWELVEAGACLWEAALSMANASEVKQGVALKLWSMIQREGTPSIRSMVIGWAADCHNAWLAAGGYDRDDSFDWDFVPAWLAERLQRC